MLEIRDLEHLESVVDKAGSSLLVVFFYTRSCGVCKELLKDFVQLCEEVSNKQSIPTGALKFMKYLRGCLLCGNTAGVSAKLTTCRMLPCFDCCDGLDVA